MHTRKKARRGRHTVPGHKRTLPVEWQLTLWLGVVALALGLFALTPAINDETGQPALAGLTHSQGSGGSGILPASYPSAQAQRDTTVANCAGLRTGSATPSAASRANMAR
ncbi:hypothetical protein [Rhodoferax sediminis]|uniref:Uncharacterized protein n=1 Tax=Rhodoferax sediminis TaxID=2509614 RepID=A0A515DD96_9BURK|nr:hypothetical protein [Rhodoferax sediminis]QDL38320.1 hypothetical protein EUB48_14235 [Rhodoferax sediminis]